MRVIAEFAKEGAAAYISHLDLMRVMQRALRRAGVPVGYSQGFNPHALVSFATAVPTGSSSACEIMDMRLEREMGEQDIIQGLNAVLPDGLRLLRAKRVADEASAPMAVVEAARYQAVAPGEHAAAVEGFLAQQSVMAVKKGKKGPRQVDIRPMVYQMTAKEEGGDTFFSFLLRHDNALALNPSLLLGALGIQGAKVLRTGLLLKRREHYADLYEVLT